MTARILLLSFLLTAALPAEQFLLIRGGAMPGRPGVRVDDFEMADAPLTNSGYKQFVDATGHRPPRHWLDKRIPAGMENMPVIFINRYDAHSYLTWRTAREGRIYRLSTPAEFEYASRAGAAGAAGAVYPWGQDPPDGKARLAFYRSRSSSRHAMHIQWRCSVRLGHKQSAQDSGAPDQG